ncbi:MAG TPA: hypothetical protein VNL96_04155 [Gemmatimonadaceae bacterium]|nr:hypothetical protein [Gemmatimonadaceae bacterium]
MGTLWPTAQRAAAGAAVERAHRWLLLAILWLFFFNALLDRLTAYYLGLALFTNLYYGLMGLAVAVRVLMAVARGRDQPLAIWAAGALIVVTLLGVLYGDPLASIFGVKQFFIGFVFLLIFAGHQFPANAVLGALLLVQMYALFQGVHFLTQELTLPPWDMAYVRAQMESWEARNLYQANLIRPFATFASFAEYQIVVHILGVGLFVLRDLVPPRERVGTWMVLLSLVVVDVLLPDRTPIMMSGIVLASTWLGVTLIHGARANPARFVVGVGLLALFLSLFWVVPALFLDSETLALRRLAEAFRFWEAETVRERMATAWSVSIELIRFHPEGLGPASVATSYNPNALVPHNNYFLFAVGYSVLFPFTFVFALFFGFRRVFALMGADDRQRARIGFCATGVTLAYLTSSVFNASFSSYMGAAYFLLMQWLYTSAVGGAIVTDEGLG